MASRDRYKNRGLVLPVVAETEGTGPSAMEVAASLAPATMASAV